MRSRRGLLAGLALALLVPLAGCAEKQAALWRANPAFADLPTGSLAVTKLVPEEFVLVGRDVFVEDLKIYSEDVHPVLLARSDSIFDAWARDALGSELRLGNPDSLGFAPRENHQVDGTVFVPVRWPWQGDLQRAGDAEPDLVLILGELTVGFDLRARSHSDYTLANSYSEPGEKPAALDAALVWTLWDNRLQQYRAYGIAEAERPLVRPLTLQALDELYAQLLIDLQRRTRLYREVAR